MKKHLPILTSCAVIVLSAWILGRLMAFAISFLPDAEPRLYATVGAMLLMASLLLSKKYTIALFSVADRLETFFKKVFAVRD